MFDNLKIHLLDLTSKHCTVHHNKEEDPYIDLVGNSCTYQRKKEIMILLSNCDIVHVHGQIFARLVESLSTM